MSTGSCTRHRDARRRAVRQLLLAATLLAALPAAAHAEFSSSKVAYVYDKTNPSCSSECGMNDTRGPGSGDSIFVNAVNGAAPGSVDEGHYTPSGGSEVTLKNVTLEQLDAKPHLLEEGGFDTAILYQTCKIAEHPTALGAINAFLESAHKVMIFDADGCSPSFGGLGEPNWSGFVFPFATNNPGPEGAAGPYTAVEPSTLTAGLSVGTQEGDAVGDANIFTSSSLHWFQAIAATNVHAVTGTVMAYSRTASGGLAVYEGEDFWFTFGPAAHLKLVFDNMLNQHWNPDKLPATTFVCTSCATSVTTKLSSALVPDSAAVTDSATVAAAAGAPTPTGSVTFTVYSDPNCQLPVAGHAQTVALTAGSAATSPIALPAGTYYLQAQYASDIGHVGSISLCQSEVLRVLGEPKPTHPIVVRVANGEIEGEWEIIEEGELEFEGEVLEEAELFGPNGERAQFPAVGGLGSEGFAVAAKHKKCKKGFVRKGKRCVSKKPVKYGKTHLAITKPGRYKLRIKPSQAALRALKKGRTLRVRTTLTFTPHGTNTHLVQISKVKVHLKKKHHHK